MASKKLASSLGVHTLALVFVARGSSTVTAGLRSIRPRRTAVFSALINVAWTRRIVAGDTGRRLTSLALPMVRYIDSTCRGSSELSRTCPRLGRRYKWTWVA